MEDEAEGDHLGREEDEIEWGLKLQNREGGEDPQAGRPQGLNGRPRDKIGADASD